MVQYGCKVQVVLLSLRPSYYRLHERQDQLQEAVSCNLRVRSSSSSIFSSILKITNYLKKVCQGVRALYFCLAGVLLYLLRSELCTNTVAVTNSHQEFPCAS